MYNNRNNFPYMDLSSRKTSKRILEPVDEWLQNEGYYRKHGPKDPTCLFRAISEQVYQNQRSHLRVRQECVDYMRQNKHIFEQKTMIPVDTYCDQMGCITEWGGENEVYAMSLLYKRNIVIFDGQKLTKSTAIDHGYQDNFYLCFMPTKQYESVFSQEYTSTAGFCQSIIYQLLYKNVFKMNNIDVTVHKMLHERNNLYQRNDKFFLRGNVESNKNHTTNFLNNNIENEDNEELQLIEKGITPFPYRVAKALDPNIYRNIDYDIWHETRKEVRNSGFTKFNSSELQPGAKCLVQIDYKDSDKLNNNFPTAKENWDRSCALAKPNGLGALLYTGHIQEMSKNQGPVVVFVEELGQKVSVPYGHLKPYPQRKFNNNNNTWPISPSKRNVMNQNTKYNNKKTWNNGGPNRRVRDQMPNDSNNDKNQNNNVHKPVAKNVVNKPDSAENQQSVKPQNENQVTTYNKDYSTNGNIDSLKSALENTHISVETAEQTVNDRKSPSNANNDSSHENLAKKHVTTNFNNETNALVKQNHYQRAEKNDIFYPPYPGTNFHPIPRFPGDAEMVNYDVTKNFEMKGNEVPSDPNTVRLFYNLGVKCYWSQNMWPNGANCQPNDNTFFVVQPSPDPNVYPNMMNGPVLGGEHIPQVANMHPNSNPNLRHNNRSSPPRHRDQENLNGPRPLGGQKMNLHRNPDYRNPAYQAPSNDNRNRNDGKIVNPNELAQHGGNKDMQRGNNKTNGLAPRFKRNYEAGKNRNDYHNNNNNIPYQYRQHQPPQQHVQPHYQQDYDMRNKKQHPHQQQQPQQLDLQLMPNRCDLTDAAQQQQQQHHLPQQQQQQQLQNQQHQQQSQPQPPPALLPQPQQQQPSPMAIQPQTPSPPLTGPYPYAVPYNQVSYVPLGQYSPESETMSGPYYSAPPGYVQVPYLPASEMPEQPIYQPVDSFPTQYPPVYSQYVYPQPMQQYQNQPLPPDGCYPAFPGQPYFFTYPPPSMPPPGMQPPNLAAPPTPQSAQ